MTLHLCSGAGYTTTNLRPMIYNDAVETLRCAENGKKLKTVERVVWEQMR